MRLLAIQELPQSKRVKLVFDDDSVLKTQPYLLADFGLYSGMDLTDEDYQALLTAAGKRLQRPGPFALSQLPAYLKRNFRNGLSKRARKHLTHRRLSAGSKNFICSTTGKRLVSLLQAPQQRATERAVLRIFYMRRVFRRNSGMRRLRNCRKWTMPSTVSYSAAGREKSRTKKK